MPGRHHSATGVLIMPNSSSTQHGTEWRGRRAGGACTHRMPRCGPPLVRAVLGIAVATLMLAAGGMMPGTGGTVLAQDGRVGLREIARIDTNTHPHALGINADESIIAAATGPEDGETDTWQVRLYDRASRGLLGHIEAEVGEHPLLRFSPVSDLLLIGGDDALQLWRLPISPLNPKKPLGREYKVWETRLDKPAGVVRFLPNPAMVYWSQGSALHRQGSTSADANPALFHDGAGEAIEGIAWLPGPGALAVTRAGQKEIEVIPGSDPAPGETRVLQSHRFAVSALWAGLNTPLLSLDHNRNLVQWNATLQPDEMRFMARLPGNYRPTTGQPLGPQHLLLLGLADGTGMALVVETASGALLANLSAPGGESVVASPTGRYVISTQGKLLRIHQFSGAMAPLDYVKYLRAMKAFGMAQSYVRLMDEGAVSAGEKSVLLSEVGREPPGTRLRKALQALNHAEASGDIGAIRAAATRVLAIHEGHPAAMAALENLLRGQERQVLEQARESLDKGEYRSVIDQLAKGIPQGSPYFEDANALIRRAESQKAIGILVEQGHAKLNLGDITAAEALAREALRRDPEHPGALALEDEIDDQTSILPSGLLGWLALLGLIAAGFVGLSRLRTKLPPWLKRLRLDTERNTKPRPVIRPKESPAAAEEGPTPADEAAARQRVRQQAARRRLIEELITQAEEEVRRFRQLDATGTLTATLMEVEAELQSIQRRVSDPSADLGAIHNRVKGLLGLLDRINLKRPAGEKEDAPVEETHYATLNLSPNATQAEIKQAYHSLLKQYHPDVHNTSQFAWIKEESERMSRKLSEAYNVLSDKAARERYDATLRRRGGSA